MTETRPTERTRGRAARATAVVVGVAATAVGAVLVLMGAWGFDFPDVDSDLGLVGAVYLTWAAIIVACVALYGYGEDR